MSTVSFEKIPISKIQEQFYVRSILYPEHTSYHIPSLFKIEGILKVDYLEKSINKIISRHDSLRTVIFSNGKGATSSYKNIKDSQIYIEEIRIREIYEGQYLSEIEDEIMMPFKLDEWPLLRVKLFVFENNMSLLSIVFHHIVVDLHSKNIFAQELSYFYNFYSNGMEVNEQMESLSYSQYIEWEKEWLDSPEANKMMAYWEDQFSNLDNKPCLPTDFSRPEIGCNKGKRKFFYFDEELSGLVTKFARSQSLNNFTILLAGYVSLIHNLSGQARIVVGVPLSNRRKGEYKNTFGAFVNILPIQIDFSELRKGVDLVKSLRRILLLAHRNQEIPYVHMVQKLNVKSNFSYNSLFQVGFTCEPPMKLKLDGFAITPLSVERMGAQLDLFCTFWEDNDEIQGYMEYAIDLFKETTIVEWIDRYREICRDLALNKLEFKL